VTFWIPQRETKKQQVRKKKKKKSQARMEGAWRGGGGSSLHERQMSRLAVEFSRCWRDLMVKALDQTCVDYQQNPLQSTTRF